MALVDVEGLVFDYPGQRALHGIDCAIEAGGITALVGPNGSGKTTLMRAMAALDRPVAGRIVIDGIDLFEAPRRCHEKLGYLSDFFGLYDDLSVWQCLLYRGLAQGLAEREARRAAEVTAERVALADRMKQPAGTLSRGLRQRLGIAQAILHEPKFVILDEPASGLDPEARADLSDLLRALQGQGMTLLVSSHILAELADYATDMLLLSEGRIVEQRGVRDGDAGSAEGQPVRLTIRLAAPLEDFRGLLERLGYGDALQDCSERKARLVVADDAGARRQLLSDLMDAGAEVSDFSAEEVDLETLYRARMKEARER